MFADRIDQLLRQLAVGAGVLVYVGFAVAFVRHLLAPDTPVAPVPDPTPRLRAAVRAGTTVPALRDVPVPDPRHRRDALLLQDAATDARRARLARIQKARIWW